MADIMTRPERFGELLDGLRGLEGFREANPEGPRDYDLILPPLGEQWAELEAWMRAMRAKAASAEAVSGVVWE